MQIQQIPREENGQANELVQLASSLTEWISRDPLYIKATTALASQEEKEVTMAVQSMERLTNVGEARVPNWREELEVYLRKELYQQT